MHECVLIIRFLFVVENIQNAISVGFIFVRVYYNNDILLYIIHLEQPPLERILEFIFLLDFPKVFDVLSEEK